MATKKKPVAKKAVKPKAPAKPARQQAQRETAVKAETGLTPNEHRFVQEYLIDLNGTQAYMRVFPHVKPTSARVEACRMLAKPNIQESIAKGKQERAQRTGISADIALEHAWGIATADAREFVEYKVGCCRYCWGTDHRYQRTVAEFERAEADLARQNEELIAAGKEGVKVFDPQGGTGYDLRRPPNPDCPECFGEGKGRTVFKDTSLVSPAAAALFAGVKETKDGVEIKVHSKDAALEKVFRHLGLFEKDNTQRSLLEGVPREMLKAIAERLRGAT